MKYIENKKVVSQNRQDGNDSFILCVLTILRPLFCSLVRSTLRIAKERTTTNKHKQGLLLNLSYYLR